MVSKQTTIVNATGLHARPASQFVAAAKKFPCNVTIKDLTKGSAPVNAKSIMMILAAGLTAGLGFFNRHGRLAQRLPQQLAGTGTNAAPAAVIRHLDGVFYHLDGQPAIAPTALAHGAAWRTAGNTALCRRQAPDTPIHQILFHHLTVWRSRHRSRLDGVGLLLFANRAARCRVCLGVVPRQELLQAARIGRAQAQEKR